VAEGPVGWWAEENGYLKQATRETDEAVWGKAKGKKNGVQGQNSFKDGQLTVRYRKPMRDGTGRDRVEGRRKE
jgi:hypothetical protein